MLLSQNMKAFNSSITGQVIGELKQVGKDVGQAFADIPTQILEGPAKVSSAKPGDTEGKALESGTSSTPASADEQTGGSDPQQQQKQTSGQGWLDALSAQTAGKYRTQQKIANIRRNLEQEIEAERKKRQQKEEQRKQREEQEEQAKKQQTEQQKKQIQKQAVSRGGGMGPGQFGKGETRGAKGK